MLPCKACTPTQINKQTINKNNQTCVKWPCLGKGQSDNLKEVEQQMTFFQKKVQGMNEALVLF